MLFEQKDFLMNNPIRLESRADLKITKVHRLVWFKSNFIGQGGGFPVGDPMKGRA